MSPGDRGLGSAILKVTETTAPLTGIGVPGLLQLQAFWGQVPIISCVYMEPYTYLAKVQIRVLGSEGGDGSAGYT